MADVPRRLVYSKTAQLLYSDTTAKKLFTLPKGAIPLRVTVFTVATATSGTVDVGTYANDDLYIAALDVSAVGGSQGTLLDRTELTVPTDIYGLQAGASSGGPFVVTMEYTSVKTTRVV